jgi:hypothetical protein
MKRFFVMLLVVMLFGVGCSAQELKTIPACRAYRDAWVTSTDEDTAHLTVKGLLHRADQMMVCGKDIDANPLKAGMTHEEALNEAIRNLGYATVALAYNQEAFNRAAWFIENKHLTHEFITDDENGRIRRGGK